MRFRLAAVSLSALFLSVEGIAGTECLQDEKFGFTLPIPDGFKEWPELATAASDTLHVFIRGNPTDETSDLFLIIERMGGTIGRGRVRKEDLPPSFKGRIFTVAWQEFKLDAFEVLEDLGDARIITYNVQIPLKREAIQLKVAGPADRKTELREILSQVLGGLQGETNWLPSTTGGSFTSSKHYGTVLLIAGFAAVAGILVVLWLISRNPEVHRGTVLALALGFYAGGWALGGVYTREVQLVAGVLKMSGFFGAILGLIDFFRKRKKDEKPGPSPGAAPPG